MERFYKMLVCWGLGVLSLVASFFIVGAVNADVSTFTSDDFNSYNLNTALWTFTNPLNDSSILLSGVNTPNALLSISVPGGVSHDAWSLSELPRVMQPATNTDFEFEVKFESGLSQAFQEQGILIEQDSGNYLRFDFYSDGLNTKIFSGVYDGSTTEQINTNIGANNISPLYMRVARSGNSWTQSYSLDGQNWTTGASFSHTLTVNSVGVFAGNFDVGSNAPAHTAIIDYVFNTAVPISPEDGNSSVIDSSAPLIHSVQSQPSETEVVVTWSTDELTTGTVEYGETTAYGNSVGHSDLTSSHTITLTNLISNTIYNFRVKSKDTSNFTSVSGNYEVTTTDSGSPPPPSGNSQITVWYGSHQVFGHLGIPQPWVNILGNVSNIDNVNSLYYTLNGGAQINLSMGHDQRRLAAEGDFNVDLKYDDLQPGLNTVVITAETDQGPISETVTVEFQDGNIWVEPYSIDWSTVSDVQDVVQVVDGLWSVQGDAVRTDEIGYDRLLAIGDVTWDDYQIEVPITIHDVNEVNDGVSNGAGIGLMMRWEGHYDWDGGQPVDGWYPYGAIGWYGWGWEPQYVGQPPHLRLYGNEGSAIVRDLNFPALTWGVPYIFKMRADTTASGTFYGFKVWEEGQAEPASWSLSGTEPLAGNPVRGSLLLIAHNVDASFGDVSVTPLIDTTAPIISNVQVVASSGVATVTWTTNEPATSSVAYGPTSAYENGAISDSALVTQHSIVLPGLISGTTYHYQITSVDSSSNSTSTADMTFLATSADTVPPVISNIQVTPDISSAIVTWTTNEPATSSVSFGTSTPPPYSDMVSDNTLVTQHSVTLTNLISNTLYHFQVTSEDANGNSASSADQTFTTSIGTGTSSIVSDDFSACSLDTNLWTIVNPLGDGGTVTASGGPAVSLSVPAGTSHEPWTTNNSVRIMQAANDTPFEIEIKFDSAVGQGFQEQGVIVQEDDDTYIRFDFNSDGSQTYILAATFDNGSSNIEYNDAITGTNSSPLYMRVKRESNHQWTQSYSFDGQNWTDKTGFTNSIAVTSVGVFGGNFDAGGGAPAHTAVADYFLNVASPINPEDEGPYTLVTNTVGDGIVSRSPNESTYACGGVVTLEAISTSGWAFSNWSGGLIGNPVDVTISGDAVYTATFTEQPYDLTINIVGSGLVSKDPGPPYNLNDTVTLEATPSPGWAFSGWSGGLFGNPVDVTITGIEVYTATFTQEIYDVTINTVGSGSVTKTPGSPYHYNDSLTLEAMPDSGWEFSGWSNGLTGNPVQMTVTQSEVVTATFVQGQSGSDKFIYLPFIVR